MGVPLYGGGGEEVRCSYGVQRMWHLTHMSSDKQQFDSDAPARRLEPRAGKNTGGSVRLSESAHVAVASEGFVHALEELVEREGTAVVDVCTVCGRIVSACPCPGEPPTTRVRMPYSAVLFDQMSRADTGVGLVIDAHLGPAPHSA